MRHWPLSHYRRPWGQPWCCWAAVHAAYFVDPSQEGPQWKALLGRSGPPASPGDTGVTGGLMWGALAWLVGRICRGTMDTQWIYSEFTMFDVNEDNWKGEYVAKIGRCIYNLACERGPRTDHIGIKSGLLDSLGMYDDIRYSLGNLHPFKIFLNAFQNILRKIIWLEIYSMF